MFAVIFKAKVGQLDEQYGEMVATMRQLAFEQYQCIDFVAVSEGELEVAISYWHSLDDIQAWRNDKTHQQAQALGKSRWYQSYNVEVVEVKRSYDFTA
ncbi:antibiotic biosynthesis monooxygenase family protein [Shewanella maritima]|uniref:antibiotic biosynthesis monooxygenase family protein n=1 Tax=Shewanella maritima TaxID=2520507 RepID=UPI0037369011